MIGLTALFSVMLIVVTVRALYATWGTDTSVMLSATVQKMPPQITLQWPADATATSYTIYRKDVSATSWGAAIATLAGTATSHVDANVAVGMLYEYKVHKAAPASTALGFVCSGIEAPLVDDRGKVILIVDNSMSSPLASELARLEEDLVCDGWTVLRHDVSRSDTPASVRALIQTDYNTDPANVKSVFLFGHVPMVKSGQIYPDGHTDHNKPWPTNAYYGDMNSVWTDTATYKIGDTVVNAPGDGMFDQSSIPSDVELQVGLVDLWNLTVFTGKTETDLLRLYLNKDHAYRHRTMVWQNKGFIDDNFTTMYEGFSASGWRNFSAFVGAANVAAGDWTGKPATPYLFGYGCGGGNPTGASGVTDSTGMNTNDPAVFTFLFGSYFGDWDYANAFLRAELATSQYGLTTAWAGRPHWYIHHMAMGETIGYGAKLSQNNSGSVYPGGFGARQIHVGLMGDPTLRLYQPAPVTNVTAKGTLDALSVGWTASPDANAGYHVYRATTRKGPYTRITSSPVMDTAYTDTNPLTSDSYYMVRPIALTTTASGSYFNAGQGAIAASELVLLTSTNRVSVHTDGSEGDLGSQYPSTSEDGQIIAFQSDATTLVDNDTNALRDIFVRDRKTRVTTRVSQSVAGVQANGDSWAPAVCSDGAVIAFVSDATNLIDGEADANDASDIFVVDTANDTVERISVGLAGAEPSGASYSPAISADGNRVVFVSEADNLVANDTNEAADVFLYNRTTHALTRVSVTAAGLQADGASRDATISADGTKVAFVSLAMNLVAADTNSNTDIFVVKLNDGAITCVTLATDGTASDDGSFLPALSADGRYVAFTSRATNLLPTLGGASDTNGKQDVYLADLGGLNGATMTLVSTTGTGQGNGDSGQYGVDISDDGNRVVFESTARNLVSEDTNNKSDIFIWVKNPQTKATGITRMSISTLGDQANSNSSHPVISADGIVAAFDSLASNLVTDDTNAAYDVFVRTYGDSYQPDLLLSPDGAPATYRGGGLYTLSEAQTLDVSASTGVAKHFFMQLTNNQTNPTATYTLKASGYDSASGWTIELTDLSNNNRVNAVTLTGVGYSVTLDPGATRAFQGTVKTFASSPATPALALVLSATSTDDVSRKDTVMTRVSLTPDQTILASSNNGAGLTGDDCGFSADGRYVSFVNGNSIRVHDRQTGLTTRVDTNKDGTAADQASGDQDISGDGRYVIFKTTATNLVADNINGVQQIFMKDRQTGDVTLVSRANGANGAPANAPADSAVISANGRFVAFSCSATNLVTVPDMSANTTGQVYLRDLVAGTTTLVSKNSAGTPESQGSNSCGINSDGTFVTWRTNATNLVDLNGDDLFNATDDGNSEQDVFICDVVTGAVEMVSVNKTGLKAGDKRSSNNYRSPVSDDGRFVAFSSIATDLIEGQLANTASKRQIFVRDRTLQKTFQLSVGEDGLSAAADCDRPTMTLDGRYVGFATATALLTLDNNNKADVYIADRTKAGAAALDLASLPYDYTAVNKKLSTIDAGDPFISGDGRFISFEGTGTAETPSNLVSSAYSGTTGQQIYVRDRWSLAPDLAIRKLGDPGYTGAGVINAAGTNQTLAPILTPTATGITFDIQLKNTGSTTDDITVVGTPALQGWTVAYKDAADTDITDQITGDGYLAADLVSGGAVTLTVTITGDAFLLPLSQYDLIVTAISGKNVATRDRVKAGVRIQGAAKADLQIRTVADEAFLGNNTYDDGTEQTKTASVLNGKTASYIVRIENDGGNCDDSYTLTAETLDANWNLVFKLADGTDITAQITDPAQGWTSPVLAMGDYAEIRVLVTPHADLTGGTTAAVRINAISADETSGDAVIANTVVTVLHQPDLLARGQSAGAFIGDGVYDDGTAQTVAEIVQRGATAQYFVTLQNDGNMTERLPVTGDAGDADWTIRYYDTTGGGETDVTDLITAGGWPAAALDMGDVKTLRIDVTPGANLNPGAVKTITLTTIAEGDAKKTDTVKLTTTAAIRQPDLLAKLVGAPAYVGDDVYAPTAQTVATSVDNGTAAAYQLQVQNDGNTTDSYALTIPADGNGWMYRVYAGTDTTTEITGQLRAGTWTVSLGAGMDQPILVHMLPDATLYGGTQQSATITVTSTNEPAYTDAVTLTTTVTVRHQGDALVQGDGDVAYVGGNQYSGTAQIKAQPVRTGKVATFRVKVENDGNVDETFTLFGAKATAGWTVSYTAESTQTVITDTITGAAGLSLPLVKGASATYLIKVMGDATLASGASLPLTITVKRGGATHDVVTATTQLIGSTARVSVDSLGAQGNGDAPSLNSPPAVSQDGRYAAFSATSSNLVAGDTNSVADIFVHDRVTGTTTRVSVSASGAQANSTCDMPAISADGRYVAFRSTATNLVAGDTNNRADVFRVDRLTGTVVRVNVSNAGAQALSGDSGTYGIVLSADGNLVAFESTATNLASNDTNGVSDIFLRDVTAGTTVRVSTSSAGGAANGRSLNPSMSADGRYLVFSSFASNLVAGDANLCSDIFLHDRVTGATTLVSHLNGVQGNANSDDPAISGNGAVIAFTTLASNLASGDTNGTWDVVRVARTGGAFTLASVATDGFFGNASSSGPALNTDGRFLAFRSYASNLVAGDTNNRCDAFVFDYATRTVTRASLSGAGGQGNADSAAYGVALDGQGYIAVFETMASNLVPDDTNARRDVLAREWPAFQPDLAVRQPNENTWLGDGVYYNPDVQTKVGTVMPGATAVYELAVQNDGMLIDSYTITQTQAIKANWTVHIYGPDGALIPALATQNGTWVVPVAGGQTKMLRVEVTPGAAILPTYFQELLFTVSSGLMPDRLDALKIKTIRARVTATVTANPTRVLPGMPVTVTATLSGPVTGAVVSFAAKVKQPNGSYVTLDSRDYGSDFTWVWTPAQPSTYTLCAYVKEQYQTAYSSSYLFNYIVVSPISAVALSANLPAPQAAATKNITLTATLAGGLTPEYQFQVARRNPVTQEWGAYTVLRTFTTGKYATWRPTLAGDYNLRVNVREKGTTEVLATDTLASYTIVSSLSAVSLTANPATGTVGLPVTLTAAPTGGAAVEYRFLCYVADWFGTIHEQEIHAYSASTTATWTPNIDHIGTVTLTVFAREQGSTAAYKVQKSISYTVANP